MAKILSQSTMAPLGKEIQEAKNPLPLWDESVRNLNTMKFPVLLKTWLPTCT